MQQTFYQGLKITKVALHIAASLYLTNSNINVFHFFCLVTATLTFFQTQY